MRRPAKLDRFAHRKNDRNEPAVRFEPSGGGVAIFGPSLRINGTETGVVEDKIERVGRLVLKEVTEHEGSPVAQLGLNKVLGRGGEVKSGDGPPRVGQRLGVVTGTTSGHEHPTRFAGSQARICGQSGNQFGMRLAEIPRRLAHCVANRPGRSEIGHGEMVHLPH